MASDEELAFSQRNFELSIANQQELFALQLAHNTTINTTTSNAQSTDKQIRAKALRFLQQTCAETGVLPASSTARKEEVQRRQTLNHPHWYCSTRSKLRLVASVWGRTVTIFFSSRLPSSKPSAFNSNATTTQVVYRYSFTCASRKDAEEFCYRVLLRQDNLFRFFVSPEFAQCQAAHAAFSRSCSVLDKQQLQTLLRKVMPKQNKRITPAALTLQRAWRRHKQKLGEETAPALLSSSSVHAHAPVLKQQRLRGRKNCVRNNAKQQQRQQQQQAATKIQRFFRGCLRKRRAQAVIQRFLLRAIRAQRSRQALLHYGAMDVNKIIFLQRAVRAHLQRRALARREVEFLHRLSSHLREYYEANLSEVETKMRPLYTLVLDTIRRILWNVSPYTTTCEAFGSTTTPGLALPSSDLDVVIHHCELTPQQVFDVLKQHTEFATHVQLVRAGGGGNAGSMYVIKLSTVYNIQVDLSFWNSKQHMGNSHAHLVQTLLSQYPGVLAPLVLFLKQYMRRNELNSVYTGGLSSIAIVLMVWIYIRDKPSLVGAADLGALLLGLLDLYGQPQFFAKYGLCAKRGIYELGVVKPQYHHGALVIAAAHIQDPLREGNNLSFGMYRAAQVSSALARAAFVLRRYQQDGGNKNPLCELL